MVEGSFEGRPALLERNVVALAAALVAFGMGVCPAEGGYFLVADISGLEEAKDMDDTAFCRWLISEVGVACMPMNVFYVDRFDKEKYPLNPPCKLVRFCLCKEAAVIDAACAKLGRATAKELLGGGGGEGTES